MNRTASSCVQGSVQALFYISCVNQLVCFSSDASLTALAEESGGSKQWKVLTTMRFSLHSHSMSQKLPGGHASGDSAAPQNLICLTGACRALYVTIVGDTSQQYSLLYTEYGRY